MAVPTKQYPIKAASEVEALSGLHFEWTPDGKMCQIQVHTPKRQVTLNPGFVGTEAFSTLWNDSVPSTEALQAIFDAVPDLTAEERGVAIAAPE